MWIPAAAAFLRVSVEDESLESVAKAGLKAVAFRGTKWTGSAKSVIAHAKEEALSCKRILVLDKGNGWPEGVSLVTDPPATWRQTK